VTTIEFYPLLYSEESYTCKKTETHVSFTLSGQQHKVIQITAWQEGNTLSCMDGVGRKSIAIHICLIESLALSHSDTLFGYSHEHFL